MDVIDAGAVHLNNHHRNTLRQLFQHPVSHNIEWHAVVSLLEAVGSVVEHHDGVVAVTVDPTPNSSTARSRRTSAPRRLWTCAGC